ncbi:MAG TPA: hypothetical protein PKV82_14140 [Anaerolineae bacterium]|nr:hypothetical protein [Anaerolineae bacterium]
MWCIAEYEAVTLFSLKLSAATASGGKTLLVPTPYALKMALLDAACRTAGVAQAEAWWPAIRDLRVALFPAERAVVTNLFQKVLKPRRAPAKAGDPETGPFQKTIGYREYVQLVGPWQVALGMEAACSWLEGLLLNLNYLGKRGSLMQLKDVPRWKVALPAEFVELTATPETFALQGTLQVLDDCAPTLTFAKANIYSGEKVTFGKERITRNVVLPYRLVRSSKSFTLYERL